MTKYILFQKDGKDVKREILRETKNCFYIKNDIAIGKTQLKCNNDAYAFTTSNWHLLYTNYKLNQIFTLD